VAKTEKGGGEFCGYYGIHLEFLEKRVFFSIKSHLPSTDQVQT